ncbi:MAG: carbon-nitrogen hydrolase [Acidobacteriia bacterium]|nr:carbon-nitrogen hydrolase [Terriglobia bacterium]
MTCGPDPAANLDKALLAIGEASRRGAQVVCLPELFLTQYFCQEQNPDNFELAEAIPGPTTEALAAAARSHGVVIVGSVFERRVAGIYHNSAVVIDTDGGLLGTYRKMHIPDDPLYYEKYYFTPGELGFRVFSTQFGRIAPLICWDQWFPEAARLAALSGAEFLIFPTAIGWHPREKDRWGEGQWEAWSIAQRAHGIANGTFVAAVNRTGTERILDGSASRPPGYAGLEFWGRSFVSGPFGSIVAEADSAEQVLLAECDRTDIEQTRRDWPFLRDRRIDAYGQLTRRSSE